MAKRFGECIDCRPGEGTRVMLKQATNELYVTRVNFQPGNGTMYELVFVPFMGGEFLVAWIIGGRKGRACAIFSTVETLHWAYAAEKLGVSGCDLNAIMVAIRECLGVEVVLDPRYDEQCNLRRDLASERKTDLPVGG